MADYSALKLTNQGLDLLAKVQAGATLTFTRFGLGNGSFYFPGDVSTMTGLANEKMSRPVLNTVKLDQTSCEISTIIANEDLPVMGFDMSEIGLFATDPDVGEILYGVVYAGATADHIPASADGMAYDYAINLIVTVSDADQVTIVVDSATAATKGELSNHAVLVVDPAKTGKDKKHVTNDQAKAWEDHKNNGGIHTSQAEKDAWNGHPSDQSNPHGVTKAQVGLGDLPNAKSDAVNLGDSDILATSKAVKAAYDLANHSHSYNDGAVSLVGSRTTSGTWTLTGLTVNKPIIIVGAFATATTTQYGSVKVASGAYHNDTTTTRRYLIGSTDGASKGNSVMIIPSLTTVVLTVTFTGGYILRAFQ